ncbi:polysaccharide biosynthesis protein [Yeosuana aromativorans]|jgi:polysaccharide export outer membrane protein|uniref:Polysaccharide biosynthesis protein n=1 Tax=Yeosuana aromativorans TaxID=288019 RepID=A0A8J3FJH2_9FLAO|nr:polysaccharide biosynthesis/export family protein [Yeosuana aromativorans]GGK29106.1 polysaccharide biosynthesis protein [Yeosuana aromativorans]
MVLLVTSCATKHDIVYFQNAKNFETMVDTDTFTPKLKVNDIVSIYVSTYDVEASKPFNLIKSTGNTGQLIDYLIDIDGNIDFPVLGKIKLLGLTVEEAKELIKKKLSDGYLKDPIVNIRIQNFRISVLGAVNSPGTKVISGERVTLIEALALAGDLNIKGRRDNILVIRDFNGTKTYTRVDLTNKEVFNSPVYYLTQNDVVYVEPNNSAISGASGDSRIGTIISITSFILTTALIFVTRR